MSLIVVRVNVIRREKEESKKKKKNIVKNHSLYFDVRITCLVSFFFNILLHAYNYE